MDPDVILKVWAVLGPLLAAAASAVWSRRVQLSDRKHADTREDARLDREERLKARESELLHSSREYAEAKAAISKFMSSSHTFVSRQTDFLNNIASQEAKKFAATASEEFTHNGQLVVLIADDELEAATIDLWNTALALPCPVAQATGPAYTAALNAYKQSRATFNMHAKRFLRSLLSAAGDGVR